MKSVIFAVALMAGGSALAQTYPTATHSDPTMAEPVVATATAEGQIVQPSNADPELDARGIAVISDPAVAPAGFNQGPIMVPAVGGPFVDTSAALTTQPATEAYPACSSTVTDNCVQTYERGRSPQ